MFRNTLTANDKYLFRDLESLLSQIQMQLSSNLGTFSGFLVPFLESASNFKHFGKTDDRHSYFIWEVTDCQKLV